MKWITGLLSLFLICCGSENRNTSGHNDPEYFQVRLNPEPGKKYTYTIENSSEMVQEVNGQEIENSTKLEIQTVYNFLRDTSQKLRLNMSYEKFKLSVKALDQEKELDAATASLSFIPSDKMFAAFDKATVSAVVDSVGNVAEVYGTDVIRSKMTAYAGNNEEALEMLNGSLKQYVGEQFFRESVENCLKAFTTRKLKTGDTVVVTIPMGGEFNISAAVVYKLVSVKKGIAEISINADVEMKDQQLVVENTTVRATLSGKQSGSLKINTSTGMVEKTETNTNMSGTMQVMGREVPFRMKTGNIIERTD